MNKPSGGAKKVSMNRRFSTEILLFLKTMSCAIFAKTEQMINA